MWIGLTNLECCATELGRVGVWSLLFREVSKEVLSLAEEIEQLGYGTVWLPGGLDLRIFNDSKVLLDRTKRIAVATGIHGIWGHPPEWAAQSVAELEQAHSERFLLGLGVSHSKVVESHGEKYVKVFEKLHRYLNGLDTANPPVSADRRVLAALGPRMLTLSRDRAAGAFTYFVPVEHTLHAREILGRDRLLIVEQALVLETDTSAARAMARGHMAAYLGASSYSRNLKRLGFTDDDIANGGSNRLVDAIVAWGDLEALAARVHMHFDAGADHVCVQVVTTGPRAIPRAELKLLAPVLLS